MAEQSLKEKTAKGLFWGGLSNGVQQLLNLFFGIFLSRILNAEDYGMVGMLSIFSRLLARAAVNPLSCKEPAIREKMDSIPTMP